MSWDFLQIILGPIQSGKYSSIHPEKDIQQVFDDLVEEFIELEFCDWGNIFENSFWDFNLKFLSEFHNLESWRELKEREKEIILRSFAWGNANAIERFHVTAEKKGVLHEDWMPVKDASRI